jgi:hypothetical protein
METSKKRVRIDYAPLNVAVSLVCLTSGSPLTQVFNAKANTYEPNRELTPTVIKPNVTINANDGSIKTPYGNSMLASMKWFVNGVDISTLDEWKDKYTILTDGSNRGSIQISKNVEVSKVYSLHFEGEIADNRLGANVPIKTDSVNLSTTDKSETDYSLSVLEDPVILYNPFLDKLLAYDYAVAHGLVTASSDARDEALDVNAYERTIPIYLYHGADLSENEYTIKVFQINSDKTETEITAADDNEFNEIAYDHITMDLRMVTKADYVIKAYVDDKKVDQWQFSVGRVYPDYRVRGTNGTAIAPTDTERYDKAMVDCDGHIVENAENIISILWYTATAAKSKVQHNEGGETLYTLESTGIGVNYDDDWLDEWTESEQKEQYAVALDESENEITDESGDTLIIN